MVTINKRTLTMLCASLALSACSTANISQSAIPEQGLTVSQLYQQSDAAACTKGCCTTGTV